MQNEKSLSLRSPELLPTKDSERNLSLWDYTILWHRPAGPLWNQDDCGNAYGCSACLDGKPLS